MRGAKCPSGGQSPIRRDDPLMGGGVCPTCKRWFADHELRRNAMGGVRLPSHARAEALYGAQVKS